MPRAHVRDARASAIDAGDQQPSVSGRGAPARQPLEILFGLFAAHDLILLGYLFAVGAIIWAVDPAKGAESSLLHVYTSVALVVIGCFWGRAVPDAPFRGVVYRLSAVGALVWNYLMLRDVLPLVRPDSVDKSLSAIDVALFGSEPVLWLQRFNTLHIVEWFSFFYFSYFTISTLYMVAVLWVLRPGRHTSEFAIGTVIVFCVGQLLYMAVPAYGPVVFLADRFGAEVHGGFFWACVTATVHAGSAMKDVFPSLHTAIPTWLTIFAVGRARVDRRFRIPAVITAFFAVNIVISTVFLRWHYVIDVVAGLCLATAAAVIARKLAAWDEARRAAAGLEPAWTRLGDRGRRLGSGAGGGAIPVVAAARR